GRRRRGRGFAVFLAALLGAGLGTLGTLVATGGLDEAEPTAAPAVQSPTLEVAGDEATIVSTVAEAVTPSVVRIDVLGGVAGAEQELGLGSGVIYSSDGHILTNNHVVEAADALRVKLASGEEYDAELVGTDPLSDLAVVHIEADGLPAMSLRTESPQVGETAIAIGSPFGLDASVTAGVVSAVGRDITVPDDGSVSVVPAVIQTDAAINPGNSGGALVDREGRLLGINTAILSGSGGSQGVGFAIPTAQAVATADQLIESGEVRHALLGVSGVDVTNVIAERLDLDDREGALVQTVSPDSGAAEAGLAIDDVIVALEDRDISSITDLVAAVRAHQPGEDVEVTYVRDGQEATATVTLGERPED
ncbi:S1C family serine protease, partial [Salsipaludibacter albus]|uniref:S1C family serine protease n=1 Tax=Salsipaludibacter albus TaxID=2849650 RepID=UPI001EE4D4C0